MAELNGHVVGHIGLSRSGSGDMAAVLWSRREGVPVEDTAVISAAAMAELGRALQPVAQQATGSRRDRPPWATPYGPPPRRR
ncbi:hypothetical protein [Streptomyces sp. NPDC056192]|uniref:hypothetical protein n=1 Tax=unclassified Streptomyces TaxID=2593676 RepID=UPI0035DDE029